MLRKFDFVFKAFIALLVAITLWSVLASAQSGNATITNLSKRSRIRTLIDIGLTYDTPAEKVQRAVELLKEIFRGHAMTDDLMIGFNKFTDSPLNIFVIHWWKNNSYHDYVAGLQQMNLAIKQRFDHERIEFAFPTRTVLLKTDGETSGLSGGRG